MADESLGHIDIRFPSGGGGGGSPSGGGGGVGGGSSGGLGSTLTNLLKGAGGFKNVLSQGMSGAGIGDIVGGAKSAASGAGGGMAAMGVGAAVGGVAIIASVMQSVKSAVNGILSRVSELARVNPAMAMQQAMSNIADMKRDMQEAKVIGPLYKSVMEIVRVIKDLLAPIFLIIKAIITGGLLIILNIIKDAIKSLLPTIAAIANATGLMLLKMYENRQETEMFFKALETNSKLYGATGATMVGSIGSYLFSSSPIMDTISVIAKNLIEISGMIKQETAKTGTGNQYFTDMLQAMSTGAHFNYRARGNQPFVTP